MLGFYLRMLVLYILTSQYRDNWDDGAFREVQEGMSPWLKLLHTLRITNKADIPTDSRCRHAEANSLHQGQHESDDRYCALLSYNRPFQSNLHRQGHTRKYHAVDLCHPQNSLR